MRRGFKSEANQISRLVRQELSLNRTDPLDVWRLAEHLSIPVVPLSTLSAKAPKAAAHFLRDETSAFSGMTVFDGHRRTIVFNDSHAPGRQVSNIAHELSHGLLLHAPTLALDDRGCREWDRSIEDEADWLSGALLLPEEAAVLIVQRGWSLEAAAEEYGVTPKMVQFRINVTGARKRVERKRAWRRRN